MKRVHLPAILAASAAVLILILLFEKTRLIDFNVHQQYQTAIMRSLESETLFVQDVLKIRYELLSSYDSLTRRSRESKKQYGFLRRIPDFLGKTGQQEIKQLLELRVEGLRKREYLAEKFKSLNALLKNSLSYLPVLIREAEKNMDMHSVLNELQQNILLYNLTSDEGLVPEIRANLQKLQETGKRYAGSESGFLIRLAAAHARVILSTKPRLDSLTKKLTPTSVARRGEQLESVYNYYAQKTIKDASLYRLYTYCWLLILLGWAAYTFITKLSKANRNTVNILESITDAFVALDREKRITYLNPQAARMLGKAPEHFTGRYFSEIFPQAADAKLSIALRQAHSERLVIRFEQFYPAPERWFEVRAYPGKEGLYVFFHNITKRKQAENNLRNLNAVLEDRVERRTTQLTTANKALQKTKKELEIRADELAFAKEMAEIANLNKAHYFANMSHELRTPLNAVIGYSEILQDRVLDLDNGEELVPDLDKIYGAGKHLLRIVNDVLVISEIEAGKSDIHPETFDVSPLITEVASTIRPRVIRQTNTLKVEYDDDLGKMHTDRQKTREILLNLISNASKFSQKGLVILAAARKGDWIIFRVTDNGIGMSLQQQEMLFRPFIQADPSATRKYEGTGLGLAISKGFAEMMGGDITVESKPGLGSAFSVHLPIKYCGMLSRAGGMNRI
ncbi:MAG: PAS domain-containing protein [Gammaproteobacteria bacterium]|nr:PAS domain-containing protein [Gammaproteobacteria bacterium]